MIALFLPCLWLLLSAQQCKCMMLGAQFVFSVCASARLESVSLGSHYSTVPWYMVVFAYSEMSFVTVWVCLTV